MKKMMIASLMIVALLLVTTSCVPLSWLIEETPATEQPAQTVVAEKPAPAPIEEPKPAPVPQKTYQIGTKGPAGGFVFYDKGKYSDGWRYLEVAPEETEKGYMAWGGGGVHIEGTSPDIGKGLENTKLIVSLIGNNDRKQGDQYPALLCDTLVYNGFDDWFLPSNGELALIYNNLIVTGIGDFTKDQYGYHNLWSSTADFSGNNYLAYAYYMTPHNGDISGANRDFPANYARAARRF